jgi:hypothetical protein
MPAGVKRAFIYIVMPAPAPGAMSAGDFPVRWVREGGALSGHPEVFQQSRKINLDLLDSRQERAGMTIIPSRALSSPSSSVSWEREDVNPMIFGFTSG